MKKILHNARGMTLIEIMVVIAIIGFIGGIVTTQVLSFLDEAKVDTAKTQIRSIEDSLEHFRRDAGFFPSTEQGLQSLLTKPNVGRTPKRYSSTGYMKKMPKDPWGCDYIYYSPGLQGHPYEVYSLGADCKEGGEEIDADIASFEIE
ncbi:MAG: type II secretion system protein GspG [Deltaproteobacteria bacterium RIFCSPLOWO2_02_FULL_44_10]|nr:MAG: type II secretion system protein GspG [Deltaproteobacteria bacterium RIFCSPHIGHO2_02_FULL_44_16]OGQ46018.1 MAG: type II secretion system protein GspG [Deltaproteobacteria bacterium RIFCSPLOWO2_02_FULL_44_10]